MLKVLNPQFFITTKQTPLKEGIKLDAMVVWKTWRNFPQKKTCGLFWVDNFDDHLGDCPHHNGLDFPRFP